MVTTDTELQSEGVGAASLESQGESDHCFIVCKEQSLFSHSSLISASWNLSLWCETQNEVCLLCILKEKLGLTLNRKHQPMVLLGKYRRMFLGIDKNVKERQYRTWQ